MSADKAGGGYGLWAVTIEPATGERIRIEVAASTPEEATGKAARRAIRNGWLLPSTGVRTTRAERIPRRT